MSNPPDCHAGSPEFRAWLDTAFDAFVTRADHRALLDLPPLGKTSTPSSAAPAPSASRGEPIPGWKPKRHQGAWAAIYEGDASSLPAELVGRRIVVSPTSRESWIATVLEVLKRTDRLILVHRTDPSHVLSRSEREIRIESGSAIGCSEIYSLRSGGLLKRRRGASHVGFGGLGLGRFSTSRTWPSNCSFSGLNRKLFRARFGIAESVFFEVLLEGRIFSQSSSLLLLEVYYLFFNYLYVYPFQRSLLAKIYPFQRR